ncbi:YcxB family protein [Planococcus alpniumensis]|uniref:YcxB family protein n=1 Tax=Planococcus alpniumensis TaxID=2708345 RepID=UPI001B8C1469|nr:YcxB family protein [Planococcus sp. MSAK28401]
MKLHYQLTYSDFLALQRDSIKHLNYHRKRALVTFCILELLIFWVGLSLAEHILPTDLSSSLTWGLRISAGILLAVLLAPLSKKGYGLLTNWQYKLLLRKEKHTIWPKDVTVTLDQEYLRVQTLQNGLKTNTEIQWGKIQKVSEDHRHLYLYYDELNVMIVPKSNYKASNEEKANIEKLLSHKLGHLRI